MVDYLIDYQFNEIIRFIHFWLLYKKLLLKLSKLH
jgi:hypothetical protein